MRRRLLIASGLSLAVVPRTASAIEPPFTVIYIGGKDCGPCISWRARYYPQWLASPEYRRVRYVEIEPASLRDAYRSRSWPDGLGSIRSAVSRVQATPRFVLAADKKIIVTDIGAQGWLLVYSVAQKMLGTG